MESKSNYALFAILMPVLIIIQYFLAFNPEMNIGLLLAVTVVIVLVKSSEIAYAIKTPLPPRPKALYYVSGGIVLTSVAILFLLRYMINDPVNTKKLILGLFIVALVAQIFGLAALRIKESRVTVSSPKDLQKDKLS